MLTFSQQVFDKINDQFMNQNCINCKVSGHDKNQISDICLSLTCQYRVLTCDQCKNEQHSDHIKDIKPISIINQELTDFENSYQKLLSVFRRMEYEIQQAIKQTNHVISTLIIPIENYRKSISYETLSDLGKFLKTAHLKDFIVSVDKFQIILNGLYKLNSSELQSMQLQVKPEIEKAEIKSKELSSQGYELCTKGEFGKALEILDQALEMNSMNIEAIFYKAEALRNMEFYEKSIIEYDRCIKFDKEKLDYNFGKGEALRAMQRYEEAIQQFDKALIYNLKHFNSLFGKADSLRMIGLLEESLKFYNFALEINKRDFTCLKFKAVLMEELGLDDFLDIYKQAAQIDPSDEYIQIKLSFYKN